MAYTQKVKFSCPHCGEQVKSVITVDANVTVGTEPETNVQIKDFTPIHCDHCGKFTQVEVSSLVFEYEAVPIETV